MKRTSFTLGVLALCIAGAGWVAWNASAAGTEGGPTTTCLFRMATHLPCPSCGTTRAIVQAVRGDIAGSLATNPFGLADLFGMTILFVWSASDLLSRKDLLFRFYRKAEECIAGRKWIAAAFCGVVVLNWIWNIAKGI